MTNAPINMLAVLALKPEEGGKGGEGGHHHISNAVFIAAISPKIPDAAFAAVCSRSGNSSKSGRFASRADKGIERLSALNNNNIDYSCFYPGYAGSFRARKTQSAACHFLMLGDLGTEVSFDRPSGLELSWLTVISRGNHRGRIILADPITVAIAAGRFLNILRLRSIPTDLIPRLRILVQLLPHPGKFHGNS